MGQRPAREDVLALREAAASRFAALRGWMEREDKYFRGEWEDEVAGVPKGMEVLLTPLPAAIVNDAVDNILTDGPQVVMEGGRPPLPALPPERASSTGDGERERIQRVQRAANAFWQQVERRSGLPPLRDMVTNVFLRGAGFLFFAPRLTTGQEAGNGKREAGEGRGRGRGRDFPLPASRFRGAAGDGDGFPFVVRSVDPLNLLWDLDGEEPAWVIEEFEREASAVAARYPQWRRPDRDAAGRRLGPEISVRWLAFWSADWYALYADGEPVLTRRDGASDDGVAPNPLGFVPYHAAYAGLGKESYRGHPEDKVVGILRKVLPVFNAQARCLSQLDAIRALIAWPWLLLQGPEEAATAAAAAWEYGPARINWVPEGVTAQWGEVPATAAAVFQELGVLGDLIEQATYSRVVSGAGTPGDAAAKHSLLLTQARLKFSQPLHGVAQAMERVVERYLFSVEHLIRESVLVWGSAAAGAGGDGAAVTLRPEDIRGQYANRVILMPVTDTERAQRIALGRALGDSISRKTFAQEYGGVADAEGEAIERLAEQVLERLAPVLAERVVS